MEQEGKDGRKEKRRELGVGRTGGETGEEKGKGEVVTRGKGSETKINTNVKFRIYL